MESGDGDESVVYVPLSAMSDPDTYSRVGDFVVDGETYAVRRRDDDGSFHYDWVSGPNPGYGFSTSGGPAPRKHERHIRDFAAAIDPSTGFLPYP